MEDDRTPPERVRVTGLQEAQLPALVELDQPCAAMMQELGVPAADAQARGVADFAALTRNYDVRVAEADHVVAGYLVWRDEAPGVAVIVHVAVHPEYQRFGVATRLLDAMRDMAREHHIAHAVARGPANATWAIALYKKAGFQPLGDDAPSPVRRWLAAHEGHGVVLWSAIAAKPPEEDDEDQPGDDEDAAS